MSRDPEIDICGIRFADDFNFYFESNPLMFQCDVLLKVS